MPLSWLPDLLTLPDSGGDPATHIDAAYLVFRRDLLDSPPFFRNRRIFVSRDPVWANKESGFWHLISEGMVEEERLPNLRRIERIGWIAPIIANAQIASLPQWPQTRHGKSNRIAIALPDYSYLVVLEERSNNKYHLVSAYPIEHDNRRETHRKQAEAFLHSVAGPKRADAATPEG